jgi:hypothetical protein
MVVTAVAMGYGADPVLGGWILDVAKSSYKPGPAPKSQTRIYQMTDHGLQVIVTTVRADGSTSVFQFDSNADGKDYPVTGESEADAVSLTKVNDYVSQATLKHGEKVIAFVLREISEDGKTMTMTYTGSTIARGYEERVSNVAVYTKQ